MVVRGKAHLINSHHLIMFESKAAWRKDCENDELLVSLREMTARVQDMAVVANSKFKSTGVLRYSTVLKASMALLTQLHETSEEFFKLNGQNGFQVQKKVASVQSLTEKLIGRLPDGHQLMESRRTARDANKDIDRVFVENLSLYQGRHLSVLTAILDDVKSYEKTFSFQRKLWVEKNSMANTLGCSVEQFSYGTTRSHSSIPSTSLKYHHNLHVPSHVLTSTYSFSLWKNLMDHEAFRGRMQRGMLLQAEPKVIVLGSSLGLLSYFTAVYYPHCQCVGYDVLEVLHDKALMLQREYGVENVEFHQEDMMRASVFDADVVVLTSLCWDEMTKVKIAKKLAHELPDTCLVVTYDSDSFSEERLNFRSSSNMGISSSSSATTAVERMALCLDANLSKYLIEHFPNSPCIGDEEKWDASGQRKNHFSLDSIISGKTSWADDQKLYLYSCSRS